jgi:hypothetical protein
MPVAWPATLQDKVNSDSFNLALGETRIKSDMDVGPAKYRRRFTKGIDIFSVSIILETVSEYNDFYNFFDTDLNGGIEEFNYNHPITGVASVFKFASTPSLRSLGAGVFSVSMEWEIVAT